MCSNDIHYQTLKSDSTAKSSIDTSMCIPFTVEPNPLKLTKEQSDLMRSNITSMLRNSVNKNTDTIYEVEPTIILCRPEYLDAAKQILNNANPKIECDKGWFSVTEEHFKEALVVANESYMQVYVSSDWICDKPKLMDLVKWAYINGIDYNVIPFS